MSNEKQPNFVHVADAWRYLNTSKPTGDRIILQEIEAGRLTVHTITDQERYLLRDDLERLRKRLDGR